MSLDRAEHLCEHPLVEPGIDLMGEREQAVSRVALEQRVDVDEVAGLSPTEEGDDLPAGEARQDRTSARRPWRRQGASAVSRGRGRRSRVRFPPPGAGRSRRDPAGGPRAGPRSTAAASNASRAVTTSGDERKKSRSWVGRSVRPLASRAPPPARRKPSLAGRAKKALATSSWKSVRPRRSAGSRTAELLVDHVSPRSPDVGG